MKPIHPIALFRLSVLGPLASRQHFAQGELQLLIQEQAAKHYDIPGSLHTRISGKTIEEWTKHVNSTMFFKGILWGYLSGKSNCIEQPPPQAHPKTPRDPHRPRKLLHVGHLGR